MNGLAMEGGASGVRVPGPDGRWLVGSLFEAWEDPLALFSETAAKHGEISRLRFLWQDYFLVNSPELIHHVMVVNAKNYKKSRNYEGLRNIVGQGLLTSEGELWKRQRKLTQPAFHREALAGFAATMDRCARDTVTRWRAEGDKASFDVHSEMMRLTFRVVGLTLLGTDLEAEAREFGEALTVALEWANHHVESVLRLPPWVPTAKNREFVRAQKTIEGVIRKVVTERKKSGEVHHDLLGMLMQSVEDGRGMDDQQLMDELLTLTLAGHETTANALTFTLHLLSQHPDLVATLRAERQALPSGPIAVTDLSKLTVLKAVIEESMRLYPPAWVMERENLEDDVIGGFPIPRGSSIAISPYVLHRSPSLWEAPLEFRPERFLTPSDRHKLAYIPFGAGPRICIGNAFAMMEMQIILPALLEAFSFSPDPNYQLKLDPSVTLRPEGGLFLKRTVSH